MDSALQTMTKPPHPLVGTEQVLHNGHWVDTLTMPNFDANKEYQWRNRPDHNSPITLTDKERLAIAENTIGQLRGELASVLSVDSAQCAEVERLKRGQATCLRALETAVDESITLRTEIKRLEGGLQRAIAWANNDADYALTQTSKDSLRGRARDLSSLLPLSGVARSFSR